MDAIIESLQKLADKIKLDLNVAYAFAALDTDTTACKFNTRMDYIEPATPAEIAWASANVRPLTPPDSFPQHESLLERWHAAARSLGTFTPMILTQNANGTTRQTKPMIQSMLDAGLIVQTREHVRFVSPAVYQWIGADDSPAPPGPPGPVGPGGQGDHLCVIPPDGATPEDRWRNAARRLGMFTANALRESAFGARTQIKPMIQSMLDAGEIELVREYKKGGRNGGYPAMYRWIGT